MRLRFIEAGIVVGAVVAAVAVPGLLSGSSGAAPSQPNAQKAGETVNGNLRGKGEVTANSYELRGQDLVKHIDTQTVFYDLIGANSFDSNLGVERFPIGGAHVPAVQLNATSGPVTFQTPQYDGR